jgi:polyribonucleotide nucleotidyltransferase
MQKAKDFINGLIAEVEVGKVYEGRVTSVVPFGAFVEVLPGKEGLCHISELDTNHVNDIYEFIKEGDRIVVKVLETDQKGRHRLSRRATL